MAQKSGEPFELRVGRSAALGVAGRDSTIRFVGVLEDSRCPIGVNCVWEGDAVARLELTDDAGAAAIDLHTHPEREQARVHRGVRVRLVQLAPAPRADRRLDPDDYVATLIVEAAATSPQSWSERSDPAIRNRK
jgi:hypothetical protein